MTDSTDPWYCAEMKTKATFFFLVLAAVAGMLVSGCASAQNRTDDSRVIIYGYLSGSGISTHEISTITFKGITDDGERVTARARYDVSGLYYLANLKPGRYLPAEISFKSDYGTSTFYLDRKDSFYTRKEQIKRGFDVAPGSFFYVGNLTITKLPHQEGDPPGQFYFNTKLSRDPREVDALDALGDLLKQGQWHDLVLEHRAGLVANP